MPTPTKGARLGGSPSHQRLILANLAQSLFEHGRITTTEAKARRLRPYAEQLITKAKTDTVANRRHVVKVIRDKGVLHTLFTEIGPAMATRPGGYTRITKIGPRKGDNAPMAVIEIVETREFAATGTSSAAPASTPAPAPAEPVAEAPADDEPTTAAETETGAATSTPDESTPAVNDEPDAVAETDVVPGTPDGDAEAEPATSEEVEAAAEAVDEAIEEPKKD